MRRLALLVALMVAVTVGSACNKPFGEPGKLSSSGSAEGESANDSALCPAEMLAKEVKPGNYWYVTIRTTETRANFLSARGEIYQKLSDQPDRIPELLALQDKERDKQLQEILDGNHVSSLDDLETSEACRDAAQAARDKYLAAHPNLKKEWEEAQEKLKAKEEELKRIAPDEEVEESAQPVSYRRVSDERSGDEENSGRDSEQHRAAMVEAQQYWDRRIMFARNVKEYLERVRDIYKEYDPKSEDARQAMNDLRDDFKGEVMREAMSPDYSPNLPYVAENVRESYLEENPGIEQEFNQIEGDMGELRDEIERTVREREQENRSQPLPAD